MPAVKSPPEARICGCAMLATGGSETSTIDCSAFCIMTRPDCSTASRLTGSIGSDNVDAMDSAINFDTWDNPNIAPVRPAIAPAFAAISEPVPAISRIFATAASIDSPSFDSSSDAAIDSSCAAASPADAETDFH